MAELVQESKRIRLLPASIQSLGKTLSWEEAGLVAVAEI